MRMMVLAAMAALGGCAPMASATASSDEKPAACALRVAFGSYAMGIDQGAAQRVEQLLRADRAVQTVERQGWGREGEFTLCARIARSGDAERLFEAIRPLLPAKPRGPITVTLATGPTYRAPAE
jgi:hypothetical protein